MLLQDQIKYEQPKSIFEHFIIVGIHPDANLGAVEEAFAKRKKWEMEMKKSGIVDLKLLQHQGPLLPTFEPQVDYIIKYEETLIFSTICYPAPEFSLSLHDLLEI